MSRNVALRAVIIDDNSLERDRLKNLIEASKSIVFAGEADCAAAGAVLVREKEPDVVFLDVELPDLSGFELMNIVDLAVRSTMKIVIYTAHQEYMLTAFRSVAFDFLQKPVDDKDFFAVEKRLVENADTVIDYRRIKAVDNRLRDLLINQQNTPALQDLCYFIYENLARRWYGYTSSNREKLSFKHGTSSEAILALNDRFVRISRGCIVNFDYIKEIRGGKCYFLPPFDKLPPVHVGRGYRKNLEGLY